MVTEHKTTGKSQEENRRRKVKNKQTKTEESLEGKKFREVKADGAVEDDQLFGN